MDTASELDSTTILFIVAVAVCVLVLFFCLLSLVTAICLVVYCVKLYKVSTELGDERGKEERGEEGSQKQQDGNDGGNGVPLRALRGITCSVESLTNGNCKQNPHYSKVEYQVLMHTLLECPHPAYIDISYMTVDTRNINVKPKM